MRTRKAMKRRAREVVQKHYWMLVMVCLAAAFLGSEFAGTLSLVKQYRTENETVRQERLSTGATTGVYQISPQQAIGAAVMGDVDAGKEMAEELTDEAVQRAKTERQGAVLGRTRGVLAGVVNSVDSGAVIIQMISAARNIGVSKDGVLVLSIGLAAGLSFLVWFFLTNMYKAVSRRVFLEARIYRDLSPQRMLFFLRVKKWKKVSVTMFLTSILQWLWALTLVGGVIKRYSYYLVPYIAAENPDAGWRETIALSRRMMHGHKWECFVYECSFFLWNLLGTASFGLLDLFYLNPYKTAAFTEYYADLRAQAKERMLPGSEWLNDTFLFERADEQTLRAAYADVTALEEQPETALSQTGVRGFLARVFGITLLQRSDEEAFMAEEERKLKLHTMQTILRGEKYPGRLFPIPETEKDSRVEHIHYLRHYSVPSLILLFFFFSFVGWMWEVSLHLISDGVFVNRGVLQGPWLPIYGTGSVLILTALNRFRKHPLAEFFAAVVLCGCVEYFTAYYLEMTHGGQKWWDYSGYFLNLHGRICAEGLLVFGLGGMAIVYFAAPLLDNYLRKLNYRIAVPLCAALVLLFSCDQIYSKKHPNTGKGITDYAACAEKTTGAQQW